MKRKIFATIAGVGLTALGTIALAADRPSLETVTVRQSSVDCTPPNSVAACAAWHEEIRRNFTAREIGMLFGAATSYPEYKTSYSRVKARYDRLQSEFAANYHGADTIASK